RSLSCHGSQRGPQPLYRRCSKHDQVDVEVASVTRMGPKDHRNADKSYEKHSNQNNFASPAGEKESDNSEDRDWHVCNRICHLCEWFTKRIQPPGERSIDFTNHALKHGPRAFTHISERAVGKPYASLILVQPPKVRPIVLR